VLIGRPGYALFEATKRFLQAQGIFGASTVVLFVAAPINAILYLRSHQNILIAGIMGWYGRLRFDIMALRWPSP